MQNKKLTDGLSRAATRGLAGLGSLFGKKKPQRHVLPHIYISTEKETKEHRAKARERAAKRRAVAAHAEEEQEPETNDVAVATGEGKILKAAAPAEPVSALEEVATLQEEEGFMQKVVHAKKDHAPRKGIGWWTLVKERFSKDDMKSVRAPSAELPTQVEVTEPVEPVEQIDVKHDAFLGHISSAPKEHVIRTEAQEPKEEVPSALDEVTTAVKENADIKAEAPVPALTIAVLPAVKPVKKKLHVPQFQTKKGFQAFLTSLNYIGMGRERLSFIQNMATMLNAGLPLIDSLKTLVLETRNRSMRKLIGRIIDAVENGSPLWRAMEAQNFFSLHALALVRIGEEAGSLSENMGYLAVQDEKDHALKSKVKMAMIYPTIVMVIMFIIIVGLGMFVLPNLVGVLFSLNVELPLITRIVIWFSDMFVNHGAVGIPGFIGAFLLVLILSKYTQLRVVTQWILFKVPGIGKLAREATIARFGVILGGLLKAGVPVVEALQSLVQVTPIASYKHLYGQLLAHITIGDSFSKSFASIRGSHKLLPASVQQLVITGEKSGSLADIMLKIADIYDKKATETAEKLPIILEPMLLLFIGGLVGSIAFAIIIPIYSIVGNVGAA